MMVLIDIANAIKDYMYNMSDVLNISCINKYFCDNIYVTNLYDLNKSDLSKLTQHTIEQRKYGKLQKLYCVDNKNIYDLNHLRNTLKTLNCCMVNFVSGQKSEAFELMHNIETNLNYNFCNGYQLFLDNVAKLSECFNYGVNQNGIMYLELNELRCVGNVNIRNINHMKNTLKKLICGSDNLCQDGIAELKLEHIEILYKSNIINLNHMKNTLEIVHLYTWPIDISDLKLKELKLCFYGTNITSSKINLYNMKNTLKILDISSCNAVHQQDILGLELDTLVMSHDNKITDLDHMKSTLRKLILKRVNKCNLNIDSLDLDVFQMS